MAEITRIVPNPSRQLAFYIWCSHLLALAVALLPNIPVWARIAIAFGVVLSLIHNRNTHLLRCNALAITSAEWDGEEEWLLFTGEGKRRRARLLGSSYVQTWLVILNFRTLDAASKNASLVLLPDMLDTDLLRRLRVRLKLHQPDPT